MDFALACHFVSGRSIHSFHTCTCTDFLCSVSANAASRISAAELQRSGGFVLIWRRDAAQLTAEDCHWCCTGRLFLAVGLRGSRCCVYFLFYKIRGLVGKNFTPGSFLLFPPFLRSRCWTGASEAAAKIDTLEMTCFTFTYFFIKRKVRTIKFLWDVFIKNYVSIIIINKHFLCHTSDLQGSLISAMSLCISLIYIYILMFLTNNTRISNYSSITFTSL